MTGTNHEVARVLQELTDFTKLDEGSPQAFRVRAYEKAAAAVRELAVDVSELSVADLVGLEGIGKSTAEKIREYLDTGTMAKLEALRSKYPASMLELTRIPGLGPKTVILLRQKLGVEDVEGLQAAIASEQLRDLPGLGAKTEEKIARAIDRLGLHGKERRTPIIKALAIARELVASIGGIEGVTRVEYAGSLRRFRETIGDIDILAASKAPAPIMDAFVGLPLVHEVMGKGDTKSSILTGEGLQVDLRVVAPGEYGAALLYFTGSKAHNIELRQRAIDRGWLLNEYALKDAETEDVVASRTEKSIYAALDLPFIAPPMREGLGEIQAAESDALPSLVTVDDIRGDLHVHSTWSGDGRSDLEDMVATAAARGLEYVAITEHGEDLSINGLSREKVRAEREVLAGLGERYPDMAILHGAELNIDPDGGLDYDHDFLMEYDWCVASVHSHFDLPEDQQTARVIAAMQHPAVGAIGHLTGRRIGKRPGIDLDADAVFAAAAGTGTAIEINCHLDRLDCPSDMLRRARSVDGVVFTISTDAHHVREFANLTWGVLNAQRGWVDKRRVVNTWPRSRFLKWAAQKRG
jgi:DNA polymerase (family 10)